MRPTPDKETITGKRRDRTIFTTANGQNAADDSRGQEPR
jgi:hypothetical protein